MMLTPRSVFVALIYGISLTTASVKTRTWFTLTYTCPTSCTCYPYMIDCQNQHLSAFPELPDTGDLHHVTTIRLHGNALGDVPGSAFRRFTRLQSLSLSDMSVELKLRQGSLARLQYVETLILSNDGMTSLPWGVFDDLTSVRTLYLSDNKLTTLPESLFAKTGSLQRLYLSSNALTTLPRGVFRPLGRLQELNLRFNALTVLHPDVFLPLASSLYILDLRQNLLDCGTAADIHALNIPTTYSGKCKDYPPTSTSGPGSPCQGVVDVTGHQLCGTLSLTTSAAECLDLGCCFVAFSGTQGICVRP